jgi:preprotein translocase SecE subunit
VADKEVESTSKGHAKQTMREKATQTATKNADKPHRVRKARRAIFSPLRPIVRVLMRIGHWKPFHLLGLVLVPRYFRNSWHELGGVTWPSLRQSRRLTVAVVIFATVFGILIALVDYGLDKVFKKVILKQ